MATKTLTAEKKARQPRAITLATKQAQERVLAEHADDVAAYIREEMDAAGFVPVVRETWVKNGVAPTPVD